MVSAFPKASSSGLALMIWPSGVPYRIITAKPHSSIHITTAELDKMLVTGNSPAFFLTTASPPSSPHSLQLLQSTGWHALCSQSSLHRILRCQTKERGRECVIRQEVPWHRAALQGPEQVVYICDQDWLVLTICERGRNKETLTLMNDTENTRSGLKIRYHDSCVTKIFVWKLSNSPQ